MPEKTTVSNYDILYSTTFHRNRMINENAKPLFIIRSSSKNVAVSNFYVSKFTVSPVFVKSVFQYPSYIFYSSSITVPFLPSPRISCIILPLFNNTFQNLMSHNHCLVHSGLILLLYPQHA